MNDILKKIKAYAYLEDTLTPEYRASFILWDKVKSYFNSSLEIETRIETKDCVEIFKNFKKWQKTFYIAKVLHPQTKLAHYINLITIIGKKFWCFDVEDGNFKAYNPTHILYVHRITNKL